MEKKELIKNMAKKEGIDIVAFTDASPLDVREVLNERRRRGKTTEFEEQDLEKRINPKLTMASAKSIIVLGLSYNLGFKAVENYKLSGDISMSSWGLDYHLVLKKKIEALILEMQRKMEFEYKAFVDTGPLVDREIARRSGLGYYGKNCSIINKDYGSFIFLGHILTDILLDEDIPRDDDCGNCTLCLKACPTGALEGEYTLNPKKCISYLTQTKDKIPFDLTEKMGKSIYGCDICQRVCPKNKDVKLGATEEFIPLSTGGKIDLERLLRISNREFKKEYGHMAGSWRGKNILKRNAIIAIGNMKNRDNIDLLLDIKKEVNDNLIVYIDEAIEKILKEAK